MNNKLIAADKEAFLSLVRLGIGHNANLPERINWEKIVDLSYKHGVAAIIIDSIQSMVDSGEMIEGRNIDKKLKISLIANVLQNYERRYSDYSDTIARLSKFYSENGFKMMLLKGLGLSLNYPNPSHRPCGDIDIWLFGKYKDADNLLSEKLKINIDYSHHHHSVFGFSGYTVENHYDFVNIHYGHRNREYEKILKSLGSDDSYSFDMNGQKIFLPSPELNALFLLRHSVLHFASTEINVRHLLDWAFFIKRYSSDIDWNKVIKIFDEYNMTKFLACINRICIENLGFDESLFPVLQVEESLKNRVLDDVLYPEFSEKQPDGLFKRIMFKFKRWRVNGWKQNLCYGDNRLKSFITLAWSHILKPASV